MEAEVEAMTTLLSQDAQSVFDRASTLSTAEREELAFALWETLPVHETAGFLKQLHVERLEHEQGHAPGRTASEVFAQYGETWP